MCVCAHVQQLHEDDQEPEWMAFGPSDRTEFIELKGLDEHEGKVVLLGVSRLTLLLKQQTCCFALARKEADRQAQNRDDGTSQNSEKEKPDHTDSALAKVCVSPKSTQDERKKSESPVEKSVPHSPLKDQFVLDGFDFSTGLSICHTLESDSDEEQPTLTTSDSSNSEELGSTLMKMLGIGMDKTGQA